MAQGINTSRSITAQAFTANDSSADICHCRIAGRASTQSAG
jgi:hypothetical protein